MSHFDYLFKKLGLNHFSPLPTLQAFGISQNLKGNELNLANSE